mgnify:CR=1 FL=1
MLMDLLEQSIAAMKEIYELEKASNDVQKQEKNEIGRASCRERVFWVV